MKTTKYMVNTYLSDGIVNAEIEVSKAKFDKVYKETMEQFCAQEHRHDEFYVKMNNYYKEYQTCIEKRVSFCFSICSIHFVIIECKEPYHF